MTSFTTTTLALGDVLVEGTDSMGVTGQTVLDGRVFARAQLALAHKDAGDIANSMTNEFYAPLLEAAAQQDALVQAAEERFLPIDPLSTIVLTEGVEGAPGTEADVINLDVDGTILRHIEVDGGKHLRWINNGTQLVVAIAPAKAPKTGAKKGKAKSRKA